MADQEPQAVIGLTFGTRHDGDPDPVNEQLALLCETESASGRLPMILQQEVGEFARSEGVYIIAAVPGKYLDTHDVFVQAKSYCESRGLSRITLVCATYHSFRCRRVAKKLGFSVCKTRTLNDSWDPQSTQWWTRGSVRFLAREILTCVYYALKGWL